METTYRLSVIINAKENTPSVSKLRRTSTA
jgi:hypothetical protein